MQLEQAYDNLIRKYSFLEINQTKHVNHLIKDLLQNFLTLCENPAIWCYGRHTKMLMADYIFEIKQVKYIIDKKYADIDGNGFCIIGKDQIEACNIDGIIISSYLYREEIKQILKEKYPNIQYLDIYDELSNRGIRLNHAYYINAHAYMHYKYINKLKRNIASDIDKEENYKSLICKFVELKDFQSAINCLEELLCLKYSEQYYQLKNDLEEIYKLELNTLAGISQYNVLMLCIDGLRRKDVLKGGTPKLKRYLEENTKWYINAYSVSTSTRESLIPAYSENTDLRTKYFELASIPEEECSFILEAIKQKRKIFFYTDSTAYIDSKDVIVESQFQTATEKIWSFIIQAENEENGLFYVHILYESHYSYPNPDTSTELVTDGSNIMFDYLERNGGRIRTDYIRQQSDAIKYLDRTIVPFLEVLPCRMVLYADHGNILIPQGMQLSEIDSPKYSYHEDLIEIPVAIKSPENEVGNNENLLSLMSINQIICSLLNQNTFIEEQKEYVKIQRSPIYNPDFQYLYKQSGQEQELKAFECFVFREGYKLVVYQDGMVKLCTMEDHLLEDEEKKKELYARVESEITVLEI